MRSEVLSINPDNQSYFRQNIILLFILWPFIGFISAIANYKYKESRSIVYLFLVYYGLTFVLGNIGADAEEYVRRMRNYSELPFSDFFEIVGGLYSSTSVDIVEPLISFLVSRFTSHHNLLFGAYAALFAYFYLKSINLLHNRFVQNPGWNSLIFMAFFVFILPVTSINGFRMWTATWVFFYGAYYVVLFRDPKYFLFTFGASLVHFSFLSINAILLIYYIAGNRNLIYAFLAIISFILPQLLGPLFQLISLRLGGTLHSRYEMYSNEDYVAGRQESFEQSVWFVRLGNEMVYYYLIFALVVILVLTRNSQKERYEINLGSFLLFLISFVNFGKAIPSFGGRFQVAFTLFATLYVFLYFVKQNGNKINPLTWIGIFPLFLYAALQFRNASDTINAWIMAPGLGMPLFVPGISLADFLFN